LWSGYEDYFKNPLLKFFAKPAVSYLRSWDKIAGQRPDEYIAISTEVQKRIKKYYDRESEIIYPPLQFPISNFQFLNNVQNPKSKIKNDYFLVVSRLTNFYKRVDIAIEACNDLKLPLKIVGDGIDRDKLEKIAGPTIEFLGNVSDFQLANYYRNCKALIFPGLEDFGLVMAEAQAFGKPVIAFRGGGALDIVKEGVTGEFFDKQTSESLKGVLKSFDLTRYNIKLCRENSEKFSFENFEKSFRNFLNNI